MQHHWGWGLLQFIVQLLTIKKSSNQWLLLFKALKKKGCHACHLTFMLCLNESRMLNPRSRQPSLWPASLFRVCRTASPGKGIWMVSLGLLGISFSTSAQHRIVHLFRFVWDGALAKCWNWLSWGCKLAVVSATVRHLSARDRSTQLWHSTPHPQKILYRKTQIPNLTNQIVFFPNLCGLFHVSIWKIAHRKHLDWRGPFKL